MSTARPLNILILEDSPADAELILRELKHSGCDHFSLRVETRGDYLRAIENTPDIILADYNLPQFNALQALKLLQEQDRDIPFIVITGNLSEEAAVEAMQQGAADYLLKDRLGRLGQAVEHALRQKSLRDEKRQSENALRLSEDKFSKAFHTSPDAITITNLSDGQYIEVNEGFTFLTGFSAEDVIGKTNRDFNIWVNAEEEQRFQDDLRLNSRVSNQEGRFINSRGETWFGLISARMIEVNHTSCLLSMIRDISDRKKDEIELQETHRQLAEAYDETIAGWSRVLDLRDKETEGHTRRVTEMAVRLACALGIPKDEILQLKRGALLHDIGKMAIPDNILQKPGPLSAEEWQEMRRHTDYALQMLYPIMYLRSALDIPYCHHERWDGSGYPRGLKGEEIPLAARIFSIVDVWDALLSDRPYRKSSSEAFVRNYLRKYAGIYFDPRLVEAFLDLHQSGYFREMESCQ